MIIGVILRWEMDWKTGGLPCGFFVATINKELRRGPYPFLYPLVGSGPSEWWLLPTLFDPSESLFGRVLVCFLFGTSYADGLHWVVGEVDL